MALDDLLQAIEADAAAERARADRETASEATAIVQQARRQASELEAELSATPEAEARRGGRGDARPRAAGRLPRRPVGARGGVCLAGHRHPRRARRPADTSDTRSSFARCSPRAGPPCPRPAGCASIVATSTSRRRLQAGFTWTRRSTVGAASSWRATTVGSSGTRLRSVSPTPSLCFAAGSRNGSQPPPNRCAQVCDDVPGSSRLRLRQHASARPPWRAPSRRGL